MHSRVNAAANAGVTGRPRPYTPRFMCTYMPPPRPAQPRTSDADASNGAPAEPAAAAAAGAGAVWCEAGQVLVALQEYVDLYKVSKVGGWEEWIQVGAALPMGQRCCRLRMLRLASLSAHPAPRPNFQARPPRPQLQARQPVRLLQARSNPSVNPTRLSACFNPWANPKSILQFTPPPGPTFSGSSSVRKGGSGPSSWLSVAEKVL